VLVEKSGISGVGPEDTRVAISRKEELLKQRTKDPALICCDYTLAETVNALGI
jgi:hypothetical protein